MPALQPLSAVSLLVGVVLAVGPRWLNLHWHKGYAAGVVEQALVFGMLLLSLLQVAAGTYSPFLYFRF